MLIDSRNACEILNFSRKLKGTQSEVDQHKQLTITSPNSKPSSPSPSLTKMLRSKARSDVNRTYQKNPEQTYELIPPHNGTSTQECLIQPEISTDAVMWTSTADLKQKSLLDWLAAAVATFGNPLHHYKGICLPVLRICSLTMQARSPFIPVNLCLKENTKEYLINTLQ